jgi:hypothetical protein
MNCVVVPVASQSLTGGISHAHACDAELSDAPSRVCKLANETTEHSTPSGSMIIRATRSCVWE